MALVFIIGMLILLRHSKQYTAPIAVLYLLAVIYLAFLMREPAPLYSYSLKPFAAARKGIEFGGDVITGLFSGNVKITNWGSLKGIILNILLFVPFGVLMPMTWKRRWTWWKIMLLGLAMSFCIEVIQLITRLGYADVDDLINNTVGAGLGYLLYKRCLTPVVN